MAEIVAVPPNGLWRGLLVLPDRTVPIDLHLIFENGKITGSYNMLNRAGSSLEGNLEGTYSAPNVTISAITSDAAQSGTFEGRIDMSGPDYAMTGKVSGRNRLIVMTAFYDVQVQRLAGSWE